MNFESEATDPLNRARPEDVVAFDRELFAWYQRLFQIRHQEKALREGSVRTLLADDVRKIYAFERSAGTDSIIVVLNNDWQEQTVAIEASGAYRDLLTQKKYAPVEHGISLKLAGKSGAIIKLQVDL